MYQKSWRNGRNNNSLIECNNKCYETYMKRRREKNDVHDVS